jgi:hypothetical protein
MLTFPHPRAARKLPKNANFVIIGLPPVNKNLLDILPLSTLPIPTNLRNKQSEGWFMDTEYATYRNMTTTYYTLGK